MSYFRVLGLKKEPFSTSPDPAFCFLSRQHRAAFYRLQIAITLKRGLSVLLGDVGTGKTTLSRKLAQALSEQPEVLFHMILNPYFKSDMEFLARLAKLFRLESRQPLSAYEYMERIEAFLFHKGVEERRTVVLLIDEAQMLPDFVLEILRILLNYETNEFKILQLVLVGQLELLNRLRGMPNLWDRVALKYVLRPLGEEEIARMIDFRMREAGYAREESLFTPDAIRIMWEHTRGYPRKVALLSHNCLESLVMFDRQRVDGNLVRQVIEQEVIATGGGRGPHESAPATAVNAR
ncbi:MAG: AAA family ATPase [Kiritimatiellae bacterium]|nr:AAA family ATPase [Kiritimatiellia bacterium]